MIPGYLLRFFTKEKKKKMSPLMEEREFLINLLKKKPFKTVAQCLKNRSLQLKSVVQILASLQNHGSDVEEQVSQAEISGSNLD